MLCLREFWSVLCKHEFHFSPTKSGFPARILSSREIRLTAPDFVLGGKNSREKNLSLLSHLDCWMLILDFDSSKHCLKSHLAWIFSARVAPKLFMLIGEQGRELGRRKLRRRKEEGWHLIIALNLFRIFFSFSFTTYEGLKLGRRDGEASLAQENHREESRPLFRPHFWPLFRAPSRHISKPTPCLNREQI